MSVVIPVAEAETHWPTLLSDLGDQIADDAEVLLASVGATPPEFANISEAAGVKARWLTTRSGRAAQMNDAARSATGTWLWFLHADTRLTSDVIDALQGRLQSSPEALFYFRLRFYDGPWQLRLNELGVAVRCRFLRLPFGDQGFCVPRETFFRLGGFDESAAYGEDHLLVWAARRQGVPIRCVPATLGTSGRKYVAEGWIQTTLRHLWLTMRQAVSEAIRSSRIDRR